MHRRSTSLAAGVVAAGSALVLAGCTTTAATPSGESEGELTTVRFALDWTPNTNHTGLFVAIEEGYFADAGIEVEILPYSETGTETIIQSGQAEFGISFQDWATFAAAAGTDNTAVMSVIQHNVVSMSVLESRDDITELADLEGLTYGSAAANAASEQQIRDALIGAGTSGDFESVYLGAAAYEAVYNGTVDFVGAFETWEGVQAELNGTPLKFFSMQDYGVPDLYSVIIQSNSEWIEANPDEADAFVDALRMGYEFAAENPDEAAQILIDANPGVFENEDLVFQSQELISAEYLRDEDGVVGSMTLERWQELTDYLFEAGLLTDVDGNPLEEPLDAAALFTDEFIAD